MGVPSFFRWLQKKYPLVVSNVLEIDGDDDPTQPNQNTIGTREFDNLYLDMNGLIHPCFHPADREQPKNTEEIYQNIRLYIQRIFNIIRPRKLLYLAVDGVAPRAKMNQQRARRFRSAKDSAFSRKKLFEDLISQGKEKEANKIMTYEYIHTHDSNIITPGTKFMTDLSQNLRSFISEMQSASQAWKDITVILSDSSVPGEGEHKIMEFIRIQRLMSGYDPNTRHCIYGLDADLIFLGLASHEVYFTVLRENVFEKNDLAKTDKIGPNSFIFANIFVLRQYMERDLRVDIPFEWDLERVIDDVVFLCFAAGNDFLPQIPGFDIPKGIIDHIFDRYKNLLPKLNSYITDRGEVNFANLLPFMMGFDYLQNEAVHNIVCPSDRSVLVSQYVNAICNDEDFKQSVDKEKILLQSKFANKEEKKTIFDPKEERMIYYKKKFGIENDEEIKEVVNEYCKGMLWVLKYYNIGVPSWSWFYKYHAAPLVSDFVMLDTNIKFEFSKRFPFKPLTQLMSVLPPQSSWCLPKQMADLMTKSDSPLISFYPTKFEFDINGGTTSWKGHAIIPFIDSHKLQKVLKEAKIDLTDEENDRNNFGVTFLYKINETSVIGKADLYEEGYPNEYIYENPEFDENDQRTNKLCEGILLPKSVIEEERSFQFGLRRRQNKSVSSTKFSIEIPGIPPGSSDDFRIRMKQQNSSDKKSSSKSSSLFDF